MALKNQISEISGIEDMKVAQILREMKAVIEEATGRNPRKVAIKSINANAIPAGLYNKVNELIDQLQGDTISQPREPATQPTLDAIWFWDQSAGKMDWLYVTGNIIISGTGIDTLAGPGCLRGPGTPP